MKRYNEARSSALEQLINRQQEKIEGLSKQNNQAILSFKFITNILLILSQLEKILSNDSVLSQILLTPITKFKLELTKAMMTIQYDGASGYTFDPYVNDNNDEDAYCYK